MKWVEHTLKNGAYLLQRSLNSLDAQKQSNVLLKRSGRLGLAGPGETVRSVRNEWLMSDVLKESFSAHQLLLQVCLLTHILRRIDASEIIHPRHLRPGFSCFGAWNYEPFAALIFGGFLGSYGTRLQHFS